jgi:uncharacterized DUF497 family protein
LPLYFFYWSEAALRKLDDHGVSPDDFEALVCSTAAHTRSRSTGRPMVIGEVDGRDLVCVFERNGDSIIPVTAYYLDED